MARKGLTVSVVTVCYNSRETIADALESVRVQSWPHKEHIVVDGASTDGTLEVVERYREGLARLVSEPDEGLYDAMNKGVRLASGDVVCFLNADDVYAGPEVLAQVARIMAEKDLDAVYGDAEFVGRQGGCHTVRRYRSARFRPDRIGWGWMPAHPTLFLRRKLFDKYGLFRTDFRIAGDFELVARMFKGGDLRYLYLPRVLVRMRTGGVSTGGLRSRWRLNREVVRACRVNGIDTNVWKVVSKYPFKILEYFVR